jgi:hypothetical protein
MMPWTSYLISLARLLVIAALAFLCSPAVRSMWCRVAPPACPELHSGNTSSSGANGTPAIFVSYRCLRKHCRFLSPRTSILISRLIAQLPMATMALLASCSIQCCVPLPSSRDSFRIFGGTPSLSINRSVAPVSTGCRAYWLYQLLRLAAMGYCGRGYQRPTPWRRLSRSRSSRG